MLKNAIAKFLTDTDHLQNCPAIQGDVCTCGLYDAREDLAKLQLRYEIHLSELEEKYGVVTK